MIGPLTVAGCRNLERVASLQDRVMRGLSWGQEARRTLTSEMECRHAANRGLHRDIRQVDSNTITSFVDGDWKHRKTRKANGI